MTPLIHIVEDDASMRRSLKRLIATTDFRAEAFTSAEDFLTRHDAAVPGCALVDLGLPGKDGFAVQQALEGCERPVVFLTGTGSILACAWAMKAGAVDFLTKPADRDALLDALQVALAKDAERRVARSERNEAQERLASLTPREREVLDHVVEGRLNKQIAHDIGAALKTVKIHRGRMMRKMGVRSVAELVQLVHNRL